MDLSSLYASDWAVFDDPISVTLTRPASYAGGAAESATVDGVQEEEAAQEQADSPMGGSLDATKRAFHLWLVNCGGLVPFVDFEITKGDNSVWRIQRVETLDQGQRFRCPCILKSETLP